MISTVPPGWTIASMADLCAWNGVLTDGDWVESRDQDADGQVRLVQLSNVGDGQFLDRSERRMQLDRARELGCTFLEKGDVLIARMPDPLGRACVFPGLETPAVTVVDVCIFRAGHKGVEPGWLAHCLNSPQIRGQMEALANGTTRKRIAGSVLQAIRLPVPPPEVQRSIKARIDTFLDACRSIEKSLYDATRAIDDYKIAIIWSAFRGELTAAWRASREEPSIEPPSTHPAFPDLVLPAGWGWRSLSQVADIGGGLSKGKKRAGGTRTMATPYLRVANVQRGYLDLSDVREIEATADERVAHLLERGDILFAEGGDRDKLGRGWVWEGQVNGCVHQNHVFRARLKNKDDVPELFSLFANYVGASYFLEHATQSVNLASISQSVLRNLPIPSIPSPEQHEIWELLRRKLEGVSKVELLCQEAQRELDGLRPQILDAIVVGEFDLGQPFGETAGDMVARLARRRLSNPPQKKKSRVNFRKRPMEKSPVTLRDAMLKILQENPDGLTPERLFGALSLGEEQVDDFFSVLKAVVELSKAAQIDSKIVPMP